MTPESETLTPPGTGHKPRLVLMGEFSSGKSTLSNILLGGPMVPMQVTATRLPPVFISYGEPSAYAITRSGAQVEVDLSDFGVLSPDEFRSLHLTMISDTLELCDLVDMPGISDPNMPADTWDACVRGSDHVIWCTHATQAWRQSEDAMWDRMRAATSGVNVLLITQFDKLRNPRDCSRVVGRVAAETAGKFTATYPVNLLEALTAGEDIDAWKNSGVAPFMERLVEILLAPPAASDIAQPDDARMEPTVLVSDAPDTAQMNVVDMPRQTAAKKSDASATPDRSGNRITPRRVRVRTRRLDDSRPPRPTTMDGWLGALEPGVI
jgi:Dynamin family